MNYNKLNEIIKSGSLQFYKRQRYVIGTVLASDIHDKIKTNPKQKEILNYLIDILGNTDITLLKDLDLLKKLDIPIIKNDEISIDEKNYIRLQKNYQKEVEEVLRLQKNQISR